MNDFTKEELDALKWCVRQAQAHNKPDNVTSMAYVDGFVPMIKKIQCMIDNYCEHPNPYILVECAQNSGIHYCHDCKTMRKIEDDN